MMARLVPNDPRVQYESTSIRGYKYAYIRGEPTTDAAPKGTVVLVHGFPDLSFGWRHQIPFLMSRGYRVIVPDMLGYGRSDAPADLEEYTFKKLSGDINELARKFVGPDGQIILGGHDWGGAVVWRTAMWYPELVKAVFSVCTPYHHPTQGEFHSLQTIVDAGHLRNFAYQLQFEGPEVETRCQGREKVKQFLNSMHGGFGPQREVGFRTEQGILFENLPKLKRSALLSEEELDHYADQYCLHPAPELHAPLNYYRTRKPNYDDDRVLAEKGVKIDMPALFITALRDSALPPRMSEGMEQYCPQLTRGEVDASHWALTQTGDDVNRQIGDWLSKLESVRSSL